jgi:hypothetical protein
MKIGGLPEYGVLRRRADYWAGSGGSYGVSRRVRPWLVRGGP